MIKIEKAILYMRNNAMDNLKIKSWVVYKLYEGIWAKASGSQLTELTTIIKHEEKATRNAAKFKESKEDKQYCIDLADLLKNIYKQNLNDTEYKSILDRIPDTKKKNVEDYKKQISKTPDKFMLSFLGKNNTKKTSRKTSRKK